MVFISCRRRILLLGSVVPLTYGRKAVLLSSSVGFMRFFLIVLMLLYCRVFVAVLSKSSFLYCIFCVVYYLVSSLTSVVDLMLLCYWLRWLKQICNYSFLCGQIRKILST